MSAARPLGRQARRLLARLGQAGVAARIEGAEVVLHDSDGRRAPGRFSKATADALALEGLVSYAARIGAVGRALKLTERGERRAAQLNSAGETELSRFRARHGAITTRRMLVDDVVRDVRVDEAESPLLWLRRRKGGDGLPLIGAAAFAAGERLRADYTKSCLAPRMGTDWSNPTAGIRSSGHAGLNASESMVAARQRLNAALAAVGPEFSGLLFDLCCFLKGLEQIEREQRWPARSAKLVARLALQSLARHYGYEEEARGRERGVIRKWGDADHRPTFPQPGPTGGAKG